MMKHSFKTKLTIAFFCIGIIPLILFHLIYQQILGNKIVESTQSTAMQTLRYVNDNITDQTEMAYRLLRWFTFNERLEQILTTPYSSLTQQNVDIIQFNKTASEYAINTSINDKVAKILILGENGIQFQIGDGMTVIDTLQIVKDGWLSTYQTTNLNKLVLSKDLYYQEKYVFPLSAEIKDSMNGERIGWCLILFKDDMFSKGLEEINKDPNSDLFLINDSGQCIASRDPDLIGKYIRIRPEIQEILSSPHSEGSVQSQSKQRDLYLYHKGTSDRHIVVLRTSLEHYYREKQDLTKVMTLLIICVVICASIIIFRLCNVLSRPIKSLTTYVQGISKGSLSGSLVLKSEDEFSSIVDSINIMEREIKALIKKQLEEEKFKKELEFKVLQNQINPHFLYNTLNSIKWMATLQKAPAIRDMSSALGRLLQNISNSPDERIPLYEEMSLLDDYMLIQNIRYDGAILLNYRIDDHKLTQAYTIKFILQPIVENAIFHGIEPKGDGGSIEIRIQQIEEDIYISIMDDGIGMTKDQLETLLEKKDPLKPHRGINGIGLANVNDRLSMTYGPDYGLTIQSELHKYTKIIIKIPYKEALHDENPDC